jgi:hypothetical protein
MRQDAGADFFAKRLDICAGRIACINQKIGVLFGHLRTANLKTPTSRRIDQLPRLMAIRILKG